MNVNVEHEKSPSEKAWDTARQKAISEYEARFHDNRIKGEIERQEMIRALTDKNLSHGASRLFCLLLKAGWMKEFGGLHREQVGSVYIDGRRLAKLCGGASVNCFYRKIRKEKRDTKTGNLLRSASETPGWIDELVKGGYIWISKQRIPNIPPAKWPNVYHCACHVPRQVTPNLPWVDGPLPSANVILEGCSPTENSVFDAPDTAGDTQTPENVHGSHRNGYLPVTGREDRQSPQRIIGNHRNGGQAITGTEDRQSPQRITGNHRNGGQPVTGTANGQASNPVHLRESLDKKTTSKEIKGEPLPTEKQFQDWLKSLDGMYPSALRQLEKAFSKKLSLAQSPQAKAEWKRRLAVVQERLLGGPVEDEAPKPVHVDRKPEMSFEQRKQAWEKAKKALPDQLRKKAAAGSAART